MKQFGDKKRIVGNEASEIAKAMINDITTVIVEYLEEIPRELRDEVSARLSICMIGQGVGNSIMSMGGAEEDIQGVVDKALRTVYDYAESMGYG